MFSIFKISIKISLPNKGVEAREKERELGILFQVKTHTAALPPAVFITVLKLCTHDQDLRIRKFCIYANFEYVSKSIFLLCVHMAFKDQQNLSKVEILFYKSKSYFLKLRTCLNILIWILQFNKLLLGESTYVTMHML